MKKSYIISIAIIALICSLAGVLIFGSKLIRESSALNGELIDREAPLFTLTDHTGSSFDFSKHKGGKIFLLNFGYTSCPDVCPTTLATLRNVIVELEEKSNEVEVLFVSVDPKRDTVEKLSEYIPYFHENITGLTGSKVDIENITSAYRIFYFKEEEKSDTEYLMSHSPSVYLIDKKGNLLLKYPQNKIEAGLIADDIRKLI